MDLHIEIAARDYALKELVRTCYLQRQQIEALNELVRTLVVQKIRETS